MSDAEAPRFERKATLKLGQRELSLISLVVISAIILLLLFGMWKAVLGFKAHRDVVVAKDHMHQLYVAMENYAQDWDGRLPIADRWMDSVRGYLSAPPNTPGGPQSYLHGDGDNGAIGYVFNELATGYEIEPSGAPSSKKRIDPGDLVLLVEKLGAPDNAHTLIPSQGTDSAIKPLMDALTFAHYADDPDGATTVILYANGKIDVQTRLEMTRSLPGAN